MDPFNAHILAHRIHHPDFFAVVPHIRFANGQTLSVQASSFHYCSPRTDDADAYRAFEVGPADHRVFPELRGHRGDESDPRDVHAWVPLSVLERIAARCGGVV